MQYLREISGGPGIPTSTFRRLIAGRGPTSPRRRVAQRCRRPPFRGFPPKTGSGIRRLGQAGRGPHFGGNLPANQPISGRPANLRFLRNFPRVRRFRSPDFCVNSRGKGRGPAALQLHVFRCGGRPFPRGPGRKQGPKVNGSGGPPGAEIPGATRSQPGRFQAD